jgi:hypothetical protein
MKNTEIGVWIMFGLEKKERKAISNMDDALKIVRDIQSAGGIEKVVVHSKSKELNLSLDGVADFIKKNFKPEECCYYCEGEYLKKKSRNGTQHILKLNYFNRIRQEPMPPYVGFAGTYNHSHSTPGDIRTNILRRATIEFYVK